MFNYLYGVPVSAEGGTCVSDLAYAAGLVPSSVNAAVCAYALEDIDFDDPEFSAPSIYNFLVNWGNACGLVGDPAAVVLLGDAADCFSGDRVVYAADKLAGDVWALFGVYSDLAEVYGGPGVLEEFLSSLNEGMRNAKMVADACDLAGGGIEGVPASVVRSWLSEFVTELNRLALDRVASAARVSLGLPA